MMNVNKSREMNNPTMAATGDDPCRACEGLAKQRFNAFKKRFGV